MICGNFDIPATVRTVAADGTELARRAPVASPACMGHVAALARLALDARRAGARLEVAGAGDDLRRLVLLAGLDEVLGLQPQGQAELGEHLGSDEVMQPVDPSV